MTSSLRRRNLPQVLTFAFVTLMVGVFLSAKDSVEASHGESFHGVTQIELCDQWVDGPNSPPIVFPVADAICQDTGGDRATSAASDITLKLTVPTPDYNFSNVVTSFPSESTVAPGPGHPSFVGATHPALGDVVGRLRSSTFLGLTNGPCGSQLNIDFTLVNATVNNAVTFNPISQLRAPSGLTTGPSAGYNGVLANSASDTGTAQVYEGNADSGTGTTLVDNIPGAGWGINEFAGYTVQITAGTGSGQTRTITSNTADTLTVPVWTTNPNATSVYIILLPPVAAANGLAAAVEVYPSYLNAISDPDFISYGPDAVPYTGDDVNGALPPVQPLARYIGHNSVVGTGVSLNLVVYANSALSNAFSGPHPFADLGDIGYTSVTVLQDPTQTASPTSITDFCSPLVTFTSFFGISKGNNCNGVIIAPCNTPDGLNNPGIGAATALTRYSNPAASGTYLYTGFQQSLRDRTTTGWRTA